ncbi:hypothetical protein GPECTOR_6g700 [Gonium pectorale]|uniref:Uncharacterized protein n=1 Tax=Gonium pectorale TaxID=33097 RepID=A0A150GVQ6_GONPE|nr:hypothetical protein GPECTOR_6g700 [Gonium pectorale]|eukprot:KXZ53782.1 hypothetical protein GPECTOR_6g700 [Gonium pectorale]
MGEGQTAWKFFNSLNNIIFATYQRERNRFTVTPSIAIPGPIGSGENLEAIIGEIQDLAGRIGSGENLENLRRGATAARDAVIAALRMPNPDGSSNTTGLFQRMAQGGGLGAGLAQMQGLQGSAADASFFAAAANRLG